MTEIELEELEELQEAEFKRNEERDKKDREKTEEMKGDWGSGLSIGERGEMEKEREKERDFGTFSPDRDTKDLLVEIDSERDLSHLPIDRLLDSQGLTIPTFVRKQSSKARKSRRYYMRKRKKQGKPYIPAEIRSLGKVEARSLGYKEWDSKLPNLEEEKISRHNFTMNKMQTKIKSFKFKPSMLKAYFTNLERTRNQRD